ncbi:hypothetical protein F4803DRAFT_367594 [Xylaria telfairii]|nr:hypothetical protein F4803DRAFT_367594 [Xylaria telfairii]
MASLVDVKAPPHDNMSHVIIGVAVVVLSIASISVGLRIYTRAYVVRLIGVDDYLSILALVAVIATGISQCINTANGLGRHTWDLAAANGVLAYSKNFYITIVLYMTAMGLIKMTFLAQYYRALVLRKFRIVCVVFMIIIGAWCLSQLFISIFICVPIAGFWDITLDARCFPIPLQWYINAGGNIVTDIVIFILPLPVVVRLNLPKAQKYSLVGIFSLGFFTCAISVIRIKFLKQGGDFSYENVEATVWSLTELCSGVTCVCLPTLRPGIVRYIPNFGSKFQRPSMSCPLRRYSSRGSGATTSGRWSKHSRHDSKHSNGGRGWREDELHTHRPDTLFGTYHTVNRETSDCIMSTHSTHESRYGDSVSPTSPEPTHISAQTRPRSNVHLSWMEPSVITTISTGGRESGVTYSESSTIYITRDIMMRNTTPP